jgi:hypothetical protein
MKTGRIVAFLLMIVITILPGYSQKQEKKQKIKSITVFEEKSDVLVKKQVKDSETFFDEKGNVIEEISYKQGKEDKHFRYEYDNEGNKIKEEKIAASGDVTEYSEYRYDTGLRVEKAVYSGTGKLKSKKVYKYTNW